MRIFNLKFDNKSQDYFKNHAGKIFKEGFFSNHTYVKKFEDKFKQFNNTKYCLATSSGTSALEIILRSYNLKKKNVLMNANTFIATAHAAVNAGANIIPVDIENKYFLMCPNDLRKKISKKTGAVVIIHIGGRITPYIEEIKTICKKYNVPLIEDAAQAVGSKFKKINAGNFGDAGAMSFYTTKVMTTGEGGMITTNNKNIYENIISLREFGFIKGEKTKYDKISSNFKLSEFSALLGLIELKRVRLRIQQRNKIAKRYQKYFQKNSNYNLLKEPKNTFSNYYKQIFLSSFERIKIKTILESNNIPLTGGVYYTPIHKQPVYRNILKKFKLPVTDYFCKNHFCPPCYPELSTKQIDQICKVLSSVK